MTVHIGTPKSGTTYLQSILRAHRRDLARAGVLYPGAGYLPQQGLNQQAAVYALAGRGVRWVDETVRANGVRHLERVVAELGRHRGPALVSAEALSNFGPTEISAVVEALGRPPGPVTVVITARDLGRVLTSVWQQNVKNGATAPMEEYLDAVTLQRPERRSPFWTAFGLPGLVDRWAAVVGLGQVTVVTTPPAARRDELWPRFAQACGLADLLDVVSDAVVARRDNNDSLTPSQTETLRQMNAILEADGVPHDERQRLRGRLLAAWMSSPRSRSRRLAMDEARVPTVRRWAAEDLAALSDRVADGLTVVGDLAELDPDPTSARTDPTGYDGHEGAHDLLALLRGTAAAALAEKR